MNTDEAFILVQCSPSPLSHDARVMDFIKDCTNVLPRVGLPIRCGLTGYLNPDKEADLTKYGNCWCTDKFGRIVIILGQKLMFQRYQSTGLLMVSPLSGWNYQKLDPNSLGEYYTELGLKNPGMV